MTGDMAHRNIRLATAADAAEAVGIWRGAAEWMAGLNMANWTVEQFDVEMACRHAERGELVIGSQDGRRVATMLISNEDMLCWTDARTPALYLHKLAVRRLHAGSWAQSLIDWAACEAGRQGKSVLRLDCLARDALVRTYQACGFMPVDPEPRSLLGSKVVRMERTLGA